MKVVILGAGFGGLACAKALGANAAVGVTLIEAGSTFQMSAAFQCQLQGRAESKDYLRQYSNLALPSNVAFVNEAATGIDTEQKTVTTATGTVYPYDRLVIAVGTPMRPDKVKGHELVHHIGRHTDIPKLKQQLEAIDGSKPQTVLVSIVSPYKCPPVPYEYAFLMETLVANTSADARANTKFVISTPNNGAIPGPNPMPVTNELAKRGIEFLTQHTLQSFTADEGSSTGGVVAEYTVEGKEGTSKVIADVAVLMPPLGAVSLITETKSLPLTPLGTVKGHFRTCKTSVDGVYVLGDAAHFMIPFQKPGPKPHPKSGTFAHYQGENIAKDILGTVTSSDWASENWDPTVGHANKWSAICWAETGAGKVLKISINLHDHELVKPSPAEFDVQPQEHGRAEKEEWWRALLDSYFN